MSWVKRNLYFLIGGVAALALMGLAGFYLYSKMTLNQRSTEELNQGYAELDRISKLPQHPGNDKVDNIKAAREYRQQVEAVAQKARKFFADIPPIPNTHPVTKDEFARELGRTVGQLQRDATNGSVALPPTQGGYDFSFRVQRFQVVFAPGSLEPLARQLGEVKAICDVLFQAKINQLDGVRRERVSDDDFKGSLADYLEDRSVTNDLAVITPYEISFQCFSPELAAVLEGFGRAPHGFVVRTLNVAPSGGAVMAELSPDAAAMPGMYPPGAVSDAADPYIAARQREYLRGRMGPGEMERGVPGYPGTPGVTPQAPATRRGLPVLVNERLLKITMTLNVVKLLPRK